MIVVRNVCDGEEYQGYQWPETNSLTNATLSCPEGQVGSITRECTASGDWSTIVVDGCCRIL